MKNLAAAAKALQRAGPKKSFEVTMSFLWETKAANKEEAKELATEFLKGKTIGGNSVLITNIDDIDEICKI